MFSAMSLLFLSKVCQSLRPSGKSILSQLYLGMHETSLLDIVGGFHPIFS